MKVYIVFHSEDYYCEDYGLNRDDIEKVFDSEDKAIEFIQRKLDGLIGTEDCTIDKIPSKETIKENSRMGIEYMTNKFGYNAYRYEIEEVY